MKNNRSTARKYTVSIWPSILLSLYVIICSCSNEAQSSYERIQADYQNLNIESFDVAGSLIDRIDSHLIQYPDFEKNPELKQIKKNINYKIEQVLFERIEKQYHECFSHKYTNYDEATDSFRGLLSEIECYVKNSEISENKTKANTYVDEINNSLNSIAIERDEFYNAIYSNTVSEIEMFLSKYPTTVMRGKLMDKIDEIYLSEAYTALSTNANTILEAKRVIDKAKGYQLKIINPEYKAQLSQLISDLDCKRRQILETELHDKLQDLMVRMENEAKSKAENEHPTYKVEMCVPRGSNPEVVGYSSNFERVYQINMIGRFLGRDKRDLVVTVSGRISGDLDHGVTISVTGSTINSDQKR